MEGRNNARQKMRDLETQFGNSRSSMHNSTNLNRVRVNRPGMVKQGSARPGMVKQASARPGMAKQGSARPGMMKQGSARPGMAKVASARPAMGRQASRAAMTRQASTPAMQKEKSKKALKKEKSKKQLKKEKSKKALKKEKSKKQLKKEKANSADSRSTHSAGSLNRTASRANLERAPSRPNLQRTASNKSVQKLKQRPSLGRSPSMRSNRQVEPGRRHWRERFKKVEETPKKSLVVIWLVVLAELSFDLGTTIIAFQAMLEEDECCGRELNLGPLPLTVATPFIFLICLELLILVRAVVLTMWPSILDRTEARDKGNGQMTNVCCFNCFKWTVKTLLKAINVLVLLNPFFGCIIAWMLLYQSDKAESFMVLGLEGGSIVLHFISIKLEGSVRTYRQFLFHCLPLLPFIVSVALVLFYLKQEGVCYIVEQAVFQFQGCELCPNGYPPIDGNCILDNGTVVSIGDGGFLNLGEDALNDLNGHTESTGVQTSFCGNEVGNGWNNTNFCFFGYDEED